MSLPTAPAIRPSLAPPPGKRQQPRTVRPQQKRRLFTDDEIAYIRQHLGKVPMTQIARALERHPTSIQYVARRLGLLPPRAPREPGETRFGGERGERLDRTRAELVRICDRVGITTDGRSTETLAWMLIGISAWRPPTAHVAADLGHEEWFSARPASKPTRTKPGTPARVAIYAARVEAGEDIWHPGDARPT